MRPMLTLIRREFTAYFLSPIAYVVLVAFLWLTGAFFNATMNLLAAKGPRGIEYPMQGLLGNVYFWLVFVPIPAVLTMRLFAEERGSGTLEMLLTAPLRDWQVVLAKYVACLGFYVVLWLPTLAYLPVLLDLSWPEFNAVITIYSGATLAGLLIVLVGSVMMILPLSFRARLLGFLAALSGVVLLAAAGWLHYHRDPVHLVQVQAGIDPFPVWTSYLGVFLAGAMFLALGLFVSSLVRSQLVAAQISVALSVAFVLTAFLQPDMDASTLTYRIVYFFSVPLHFSRDFTRGLIDTRHLLLYGSVTLFCLFMTVRSLESRRWR